MSSEHCGFIVKVKNLRPHSNADKLQIATFCGNDTCVSLDVVKGEIGIYFPTDLQLSEEFCEYNNLVSLYFLFSKLLIVWRLTPIFSPNSSADHPTVLLIKGNTSSNLLIP